MKKVWEKIYQLILNKKEKKVCKGDNCVILENKINVWFYNDYIKN